MANILNKEKPILNEDGINQKGTHPLRKSNMFRRNDGTDIKDFFTVRIKATGRQVPLDKDDANKSAKSPKTEKQNENQAEDEESILDTAVSFTQDIAPEKVKGYASSPQFKKKEIRARIPENFEFGLGNTWDSYWGSLMQAINLGNSKAGIGQDLLSGATGISLREQSRATKFLKPESQNVPLELEFFAWSSALEDVIYPVLTLFEMTVPESASLGGLGPKAESFASETGFTDYWVAPPRIKVDIGSYFQFKNMQVEDCNVTWGDKLDPNGYPLTAVVNLTLSHSDDVTLNDRDDTYKSSSIRSIFKHNKNYTKISNNLDENDNNNN